MLKVKNLGISMVFLCSVALFGLICGKLQLPGSSITFFLAESSKTAKAHWSEIIFESINLFKNLKVSKSREQILVSSRRPQLIFEICHDL